MPQLGGRGAPSAFTSQRCPGLGGSADQAVRLRLQGAVHAEPLPQRVDLAPQLGRQRVVLDLRLVELRAEHLPGEEGRAKANTWTEIKPRGKKSNHLGTNIK